MTAPATRRTAMDRASAPGHRRAFTLVELIAVTVVLLVLAAVAIPRLSLVTDARAAGACRLIARDVQYARERAMVGGARSWVVFEVPQQRYSIRGESTSAPGRAGATVLTDPFTGRSMVRTLDTGDLAGVRLLSAAFGSGAEVGFTWLGQPLSASEAPLASSGGVTLTGGGSVTVHAATGAVSWSAP